MEGQKADKSYVILQGHVDIVSRDPAGDEFGIDRLGPGELFGEIALLRRDQTARPQCTSAEQPGRVRF